MQKLMHILFLSCEKATELIEKKIHFKLSFRESLQLKLHKLMCDPCAKYEIQSGFIEEGIRNLQKKDPILIDYEKLKQRISIKLNDLNAK